MTGDWGEVVGPGTVRFTRLLPGPIERVWAFLTESERRAEWLAAGPIDLRVGGRVELHFLHRDLSAAGEVVPERYREFEGGGSLHGRVTACDPPTLLAYTWGEGSRDASEVSFALATQPDGAVLLTLTHRRLDEPGMQVRVATGWHVHLAILADRLAGRPRGSFWAAHAAAEGEYRVRMTNDE
jgi:uncharacterized protein YndB with AHSA1/START domain